MNRNVGMTFIVYVTILIASCGTSDISQSNRNLYDSKNQSTSTAGQMSVAEDSGSDIRSGKIVVVCLENIKCRIHSITNVETQISPLSAYVKPGLSEITVASENYKPSTITVNVDAGQTVRVQVKLEPLPSMVTLLSVPDDLTVSLDGKYLGIIPAGISIEVEPGIREFQFTKAGYSKQIIERYFKTNSHEEISVVLNGESRNRFDAKLTIFSNREWEFVKINGKRANIESGQDILLEPGSYDIEIKFGDKAVSRRIDIKPTESKVVRIDFQREQAVDRSDFMPIEGGYALVGSSGFEKDNPFRHVYINGFWVQSKEVEVGNYAACVNEGQCARVSERGIDCNAGDADKQNYPVNCITGPEAEAYADWLTKKDGRNIYRLPTREEWERVARGAEGKRFPWGDIYNRTCNTCDKACGFMTWKNPSRFDGWANTSPVGGMDDCVTSDGVFDIIGNVAEIVTVGSDREYEIKGGSWGHADIFLEPAYTKSWQSEDYDARVGFRLVTNAVEDREIIDVFESIIENAPLTGASNNGVASVYVENTAETSSKRKMNSNDYSGDLYAATDRNIVYSMAQTRDSYRYYVGTTKEIDGPWQGWLFKTDQSGKTVWERRMSHCDGDNVLKDIVLTEDDEVVVAGYMRSSQEKSRSDGWIVKVSAEGDGIWTRRYEDDDDEIFNSISMFDSGEILVSGRTTSSANHSMKDAYVMKLDASGKIIWKREYGGEFDDVAISSVTMNEGFAVAGWTNTNQTNGQNAWLIRADGWGNVLWSRTWDGGHDDIIFGLAKLPDDSLLGVGNTAVSGDDLRKGLILMFDPEGAIQKAYTLGVDEARLYNAYRAQDGNLYLVGSTSDINKEDVDGWIVQLNDAGEVIRQWFIDRASDDRLYDIATDSSGNISAVGYSSGSVGEDSYGWFVRIRAEGSGLDRR